MELLLQFANVLVIPGMVYIVVLERRLMRLEVRLELLLNQLQRKMGHEQAKEVAAAC